MGRPGDLTAEKKNGRVLPSDSFYNVKEVKGEM